ncbi:DNA segregation ATPase FtsK/SpoIIIE, S-DNA-T family [Thermus arciformis]|uniref:DNA segregation ATPase FtsK/SpoIIIE, S-DNA-T family n=1 Tax=Thermus arciformis TaxID=482827 RepID=A0A1G7JVC6_9DEIN|nr:DNA translocase FtsK [Thermus arciformis]SDF28805.1 DNA segregation ATPase FtsK/SpoIIIE, S-DNA-T family [Thermus arciformis]
MAKRKPAAKPLPNRDLEAWSAVVGGVGFFLLAPLGVPTGALGAFLKEHFYGLLGLPAYLLALSFFPLAYALYRRKALKPLLRHLLFLHLLAFSLLPLLGPLSGKLGGEWKAALEAKAGLLGLSLPLLLASVVADLWRGRPPFHLLLSGFRLGVEGVRKARQGLKTLFLRQTIRTLARLYPEHAALKALAQSLGPKELPEVEKALRGFLQERAAELERRLAEEERPLLPRLQALLQGLSRPLAGEGPLRDALEERRAALFLEAQALLARVKGLGEPVRVRPSLKGLLRGRRLLLERQARWEEASGLLEDLEARFQDFSRWLRFLEAHPEAQREGLRALLTGAPPPEAPSPATPEPPADLDLDLIFPEPPKETPKPLEPKPPPPSPSTALALPTPDLLDPPEPKERNRALEEEAERLKRAIGETLKQFGVQAEVVGHARGPSVTRYELLPAPGEKISRIQSLQNDLARALAVGAVRIEAPIPGKNTVGLEVPNPKRELVRFSEAVLSPAYGNAKALLPLVLGKSIEGEVWVRDLAKMPHLLIAGSTGSGKSVAINVLIQSLLFKHLPTALRLLLIDPKMVELTPYEGIPHLVRPVVTSPEEAAGVLQGAVAHMERRYRLMSQVGARNLEQYNAKVGPEEALPYLVIVVDELADLMMTAPKEVEAAILRLAQMARATGMHLILATQRPSVDILTSLIKVNIPARLAFAVSSGFDSRTILDTQGAEKLIGQGDALFYQPGMPKPVRLQVPYLSEEEVARVAGFLRAQSHEDRFAEAYGADFEPPKAAEGGGPGEVDFSDPLLKKAAEIVVEEGYGSVSRLQRRLSVGHARAGKLMDALEAMGIVGPPRGSKPREVLVTKDQLKDFFG